MQYNRFQYIRKSLYIVYTVSLIAVFPLNSFTQIPIQAKSNFEQRKADTLRVPVSAASQIVSPATTSNLGSPNPLLSQESKTNYKGMMLITGLIAEETGTEWVESNTRTVLSYRMFELSAIPADSSLRQSRNYKWKCKIRFDENYTGTAVFGGNYMTMTDAEIFINVPMSKYEEYKKLITENICEKKSHLYIFTSVTIDSNNVLRGATTFLKAVIK